VNSQIGVGIPNLWFILTPFCYKSRKSSFCVIANGHLARQNETTTLRQPRHVNDGYNTINYLAMF